MIKKEDYNSYYILGLSCWNQLKIEDAIINFRKALEKKPDFSIAKKKLNEAIKEREDLISYLTFFNPQNNSSNSIILANQKLQNIKNNIDLEKKISNEDIINLYTKIQKILISENIILEIEATQIHRESLIKYQCNRHHEVFNTYNIIPENCFGCFKIQIQPKNIMDFLKLYLVFDNLKLKKNLARKCMIETRKNIEGSYKGLIFCIGLEEANQVINAIRPIIEKTIGKDLNIEIKRGCSEFGMAYPEYKNINPKNKMFMSFKNEWKEKENLVDKKIKKRGIEKIIPNETLKGITLKDSLIINNWLFYAQKINDKHLHMLSNNIYYSKYVDNLLIIKKK